MKHLIIFGLALISQVVAIACFVISWDIATTVGSEETILLKTLMAVVFLLNPFIGLTGLLDNTLRVPDAFYYFSFLFSFILWLLFGYLIARKLERRRSEEEA